MINLVTYKIDCGSEFLLGATRKIEEYSSTSMFSADQNRVVAFEMRQARQSTYEGSGCHLLEVRFDFTGVVNHGL